MLIVFSGQIRIYSGRRAEFSSRREVYNRLVQEEGTHEDDLEDLPRVVGNQIQVELKAMTSNSLPIGAPGVHYGKVFRMLHIGYSPQHGQRFYVPVSQLYVGGTLKETTWFRNPILAPVTRRREFKTGGMFEVIAKAFDAPNGVNRTE